MIKYGPNQSKYALQQSKFHEKIDMIQKSEK